MFARFITANRCIHSTKNIFSKFKFSEVETEKILSAVNCATAEDLTDWFKISKSTATKLYIGRQRIARKDKNVDSIDELQSISGVSENVLKKMCKQILNDEESTRKESDEKIRNPILRSPTSPPIPIHVISQINSFTAIQCGPAGFSWCTFEITPNQMTRITHWEFRPLPETRLTLYESAAFISSTLTTVPQSDFYIFEDPAKAGGGVKARVILNTQVSHMIGMASVLFAQRSTLPIHEDATDVQAMNNVAYLRKYLYARLFGLYVGQERISSTDSVEAIIRKTNISGIMQDNLQTLLQVNDDLRENYFSSASHDKDFLGSALLTGLAFLRLSILKCPQSMKLVAK